MEYDKLQLIENKAEKLLSGFKNDNDSSTYANALFFMLIIFLIALMCIYIYSESYLLVYVSVLIIAVVIYRGIISGAAKDTNALSNYKSFDQSNKTEYVERMLKYLSAEISLKMARIKGLRLVYMITFPFFLLMIRQLYGGAFEGHSFLWHLIAALFIGIIYWSIFFRSHIVELEFDKSDVTDMLRKIKL